MTLLSRCSSRRREPRADGVSTVPPMGNEIVLDGGGEIEPGHEIRLDVALTNTSEAVDEG